MSHIKDLLLLIKKNLVILVRSKSSALIVILAPLLLILLMGLSYSTTSSYGLNIGVHGTNFNGIVGEVINSLEGQGFQVITYNQIEDCIDDVKHNTVHTCVSVPENFDVDGNEAKEVTFYLDQSKINLVWIIQETLQEEFNLRTQEISEGLVDDIFYKISVGQTEIETEMNNLNTLKTTNDEVSTQSTTISSSLSAITFNQYSATVDETVLTGFQTTVTSRIDTAITEIDDVREAVDDLNNITASEEEDIEDLLSDLETSLNSTKNIISGNSTGTFADIESAIDDLEAELSSANTNLNEAAVQVGTINTDITSLGESITSVSSSISSISSSLDSVKAKLGTFDVSDSGVISAPLVTNIETISSEESHLNYAFPILLTLVVMFLAIMLGSTLVMVEKTSQAYVRNFLIPVKKIVFVLATVITNLILVSVQLIVILLISLAFVPNLLASLPLIFLILLFSALVFTLVGMVVGYLFSSEETAILASISTGSLFLFLSGVVLPVEGMSTGLRELTMLNPFMITEKLIREIFIFSSGFTIIWEDLVMMFLYSIILFFAIMVIDSVASKHLLGKIMYKHHKKHRQHDMKVKLAKERAMYNAVKGKSRSNTGKKTKTSFFSKVFGKFKRKGGKGGSEKVLP